MAFSRPIETGVRKGDQPPRYLPTEEEIAARCEAIQASWSPQERRVRWLIAHSVEDSVRAVDLASRPRWTPQQLQTVDFCVGDRSSPAGRWGVGTNRQQKKAAPIPFAIKDWRGSVSQQKSHTGPDCG